jgi:hypothetical protein
MILLPVGLLILARNPEVLFCFRLVPSKVRLLTTSPMVDQQLIGYVFKDTVYDYNIRKPRLLKA